MHPRRLARSVARHEFERQKADKRYFIYAWRDTVKGVLSRKGGKRGK